MSTLTTQVRRGSFRVNTLSCIAVLATASLPVHAQQDTPTLTNGSFTLDASIGIEVFDSDNIFSTSAETLSDRMSVLTPSLQLSSEPGDHRFELDYQGEIASYSSSSPDDYDDHALVAGAYLALGTRGALDLVASRQDEHENRGTGITEGFDILNDPSVPEPDQYTADETTVRFRYGTDESLLQIELELTDQDIEYTNNLERTNVFDRSNQRAQLTLGFALSPSTAVQFVARSADIDYAIPRAFTQRLDSTESTYLVGVRWEATGKTTGTVRIGQVDKVYDDQSRPDFSATNWEVEVRWSPRTYSHVDIVTERFPSESTVFTGDVIDNERYSVSWTHEWSERFETEITTETVDQKFRDSVAGRAQDYSRFGFLVRYHMRNWLMWEGGIDDINRSSNIDRFTFDGRIIKLGARILF